MYVCVNCEQNVDGLPDDRIRCPHCGYRLFFKRRPPIVKEVQAR